MRIVRVPAVQSGLMDRAHEVRNVSQRRINDFTKAKLIEHQLLPRTTSFVPVLTDTSIEARKTIVRLKTLLARALEKRVPYVEYTDDPYLEVAEREKIVINLKSLSETYNRSYSDFSELGSIAKEDLADSSKFGRAIRRYINYLQYLCLKKAIPLRFEMSFQTHLTSRSVREYEKMTTIQQHSVSPEIQYTAKITIYLARWYHSEYRDLLRRGNDVPNFEEFLARKVEEIGESQTFDWTNWTHSSYLRSREEPAAFNRYTRYRTPEVLFFYLPQIQQVLRTLTRKTTYVPSAFSIGSAEAA